jgi:hypothetical protein
MKNTYTLIVVTFFIAALTACKKDTQPVTPKTDVLLPITGTWLETKLRCYSIDINGNVVSDTTYSGSAFTDKDFIKISTDSTCSISADYNFNGFGKGYPISRPGTISSISYVFLAAGPYEYALIKPQPAVTATNLYGQTIQTPDENTLVISSVYLSGAGAPTPLNFPYYRTIAEAYYSK